MKYIVSLCLALCVIACDNAQVEQTKSCEIYGNCSSGNVWGSHGKNIWGQ